MLRVDVVIGAHYNLTEIMVCQMESTLVEAGSAVVAMTPSLEDLQNGCKKPTRKPTLWMM